MSLLQVAGALMLVLAAIALFAWLMRRYVPGQTAAHGLLKVRGGVMVGPKERLVLVEVGDTWLLLGVAGGSVNLVHSLPRPEGAESASADSGTFSRLLQRARAKPGASLPIGPQVSGTE